MLCDLGLGHAYFGLVSTWAPGSCFVVPLICLTVHSELLSFLPAPAVLSPGGPAIPGHLWLRPSVPESPELLDTGPLGRNLLVSLSHLFPPDPAGPAPPFGSLFPSSSQPGSQRPTRSFLSCFLAFSREEGLSRSLPGSLARWHIHPAAISCPGRALRSRNMPRGSSVMSGWVAG